MRYVKFFPGEPEVSALCLGTALFGSSVNRIDAFKQMDLFLDNGGNFFDTARVYADWLPGGHGASEETLGSWIRERKCRDRVIVSTKGAHPKLETMNIPRMSPKELRLDLEESLKTLGTDYIDVYFLHRDDISLPADEIIGSLEKFRKEGKIKNYGCSNWKQERIEDAAGAAVRLGSGGFACNQVRWGIGDINAGAVADKTTVNMDRKLFEYHRNSGMAVMSYTSSCNGYFTKKLRGDTVKPSCELVYGNSANQKICNKLELWEKEFNLPVSALVLAYISSHEFPASAISSFSSISQLEEVLLSGNFNFPRECLDEIDEMKHFVF